MDGVSTVGRLILAAVFALAGVTKLTDRTGSTRSMVEFGLPPVVAGPFAVVLPLLELACAVALVSSSWAWWGAVGVLMLLVMFITGITISLARGRAPDCHCFGQLRAEPVGPKTLARNLVLAGIAGIIVWQGAEAPRPGLAAWVTNASGIESISAVLTWIAVLLASFALFVVFQVLRQNGRLLMRLEAIEGKLGITPGSDSPGLPVGGAAPGFSLRDLNGRIVTLEMLQDGSKPTLLVFTEPRCGACDLLLPDVARWQREHADRLSTVVISRGTIGQNRNKSAKHDLRTVLLQTNRETAEAYRVAGAPSAVLVSDGKIARPTAAGADAIRSLVSDVTVAKVRKGDPAPRLRLSDLRGDSIDLSLPRGRSTLLLFWNPSCGFCQQMLDELKAWEVDPPSGAPGLIVISSGSAEANEEQGFRSPVVLDADFQTGAMFGMTGTPSAVLLDEHGRVASDIAAGRAGVMALARRVPPSEHAPITPRT
jgi:methylamine dehydrogenase accessory protein MauD